MELNEYIEKGGQKLRLGYTTGSCAAAAAKAAAAMLLTGRIISQVSLQTPKGLKLILDIEDIRFLQGTCSLHGKDRKEMSLPESGPAPCQMEEGELRPPHPGYTELSAVSCAVRKDSGDDPDITNHVLIYATAARSDRPGIHIDGGEGVGRVTKPGLDQPVGSAAINSTPRRMIAEAVRGILRDAWKYRPDTIPQGRDITISVPDGRELAAKTFNPRLGIEGGISILGTSGIVEPMSDQALLDTIRVEVRVRKEEGLTILPAAPGNYGKNFFLEKYGFSLETAVTASNFIYDTVLMAADAGFRRMLFVGHIGKLVKVAGGIRNTHSQYGDHRMEILTEIAESILSQEGTESESNHQEASFTFLPRETAEGKPAEEKPEEGKPAEGKPYSREVIFDSLKQELADCVMTDEAVNILRKYGLDKAVMAEMTRRIQAVMEGWSGGRIQVGVIVFSNVHGELGRTGNALEYMRLLKEQLREIE